MSTTIFKFVLSVAAIFCIISNAYAQTGGIVAGQTAGMLVTHPTNAFLYCDYQPPHSCNTLDVDADGVADFTLHGEMFAVYELSLRSLAPNDWQVLISGYPNRPLS